jgi:hypothetical protein
MERLIRILYGYSFVSSAPTSPIANTECFWCAKNCDECSLRFTCFTLPGYKVLDLLEGDFKKSGVKLDKERTV